MPQSQLPVHTHFIFIFIFIFSKKKKEQERERERVSETTAGLHIGGMIAFSISHL